MRPLHGQGPQRPCTGRRTITTTTTTARYKGQCNYCHDPIEIGDRIRRDLDGVSWVHADHDLNA